MIDRKIIEELAAEELVDANTKHEPKFNSPHEAYAVLKEEVEEAKCDFEAMESLLNGFWHKVKRDEEGKVTLENMRMWATACTQELIQVIAMCDKALKLY